MKRFAIVAEYNPFHSGHAHQIAEIRRLYGRSGIIVLLSGYFCQRGEPALLSPYVRTEQALLNGADLVLRLPTITTLSSAEAYARGAVHAIKELQIPNQAFGYEQHESSELVRIAEFLRDADNNDDYLKILKENLHLGYAHARSLALSHFLPMAEDILNHPNQILAVEYLKSNLQLKGKQIKPIFIKRQGSAYLTETIDQTGYASATALRKLSDQPISSDLLYKLKQNMPVSSAALLLQEMHTKHTVKLNDFADEFLTLLSRDTQPRTRYLTDELYRRLYNNFTKQDQFSLNDLIAQSKSRQYPESRLQRTLCNLLLNIGEDDDPTPQYLQVLGFNRDGRYLLRKLQELSDCPLIANLSDLNDQTDPMVSRQYQQDRLACRLWANKAGYSTAELLQKPIYKSNI